VDIVVVRAGVTNRLTSSLRADLAARLRALPGVTGVNSSLTEMVSLGDTGLVGIPLRGVDLSGTGMQQFATVAGHTLEPTESGGVLLGSGIAAAIEPNAKQIEIEGKEFQVEGTFAANNPFDINSIVASLADVQKLMGRPDVVTEFQLRVAPEVRDDAALRKLCRSIEELKDKTQQPLGLKAQPTNQFIHTATESRLGGAMAWGTSAIVFSLSFLAIFNTMLMSVMERTAELGVLRAIGWTKSRILHMIVSESLLMSVAGAAAGVATASLLGWILSRSPSTNLFVPSRLSPSALAIGCIAAVVAAIAGSLYPAVRAATILPTEALRYE
jgi:putative ABC transport system permease protein